MLSCRQISILVSESLDRELPLRKRVAVWLHLMMCRFCARYRKQLLFLRDAADAYARQGEDLFSADSDSLSPEAHERIKRALRRQAQNQDEPKGNP